MIRTFRAAMALSMLASAASAQVTTAPGSGSSPTFTATGSPSGSSTTGLFSAGTLSYSDTGNLAALQASIAGVAQVQVQNTSANAAASADIIVANDQATASTHYGDFGINSSAFTGTGSLNLAGATYLYSATGDLVLGTSTLNAIRFVVNNGSTDAGGFSTAGVFSLGTPLAVGSGGTGVANTGNLTWNAAQTFSFTSAQTMTFPAATTTLAGLGTAQTFSAANIFSAAGAASTPGLTVSGAPYTGGTGTTNFPQLYVNSGAAPTTFSTSGTMFGVNAPSGFGGNLLDLRVNGSANFYVTQSGALHTSGSIFTINSLTLGGSGNGIFAAVASGGGVQLGGVDAAAPVAQTLKTQNVVGGTSNVAGVNLTIAGSQGTGTGAGGSLILQTAVTGTTGTTQNAEQTVATIDTNQHVKFSSAAIPTIGTCGTGSPSVTAGSTDTAGAFTTGTTASACTLTFKIAYTTAPFCNVSDITLRADLLSYAISTTALTLTMTANSGDVVDYVCFGN